LTSCPSLNDHRYVSSRRCATVHARWCMSAPAARRYTPQPKRPEYTHLTMYAGSLHRRCPEVRRMPLTPQVHCYSVPNPEYTSPQCPTPGTLLLSAHPQVRDVFRSPGYTGLRPGTCLTRQEALHTHPPPRPYAPTISTKYNRYSCATWYRVFFFSSRMYILMLV